MSYTALYRKFRPQSFDEVRGQEAVVTTLKNQVKTDHLGHAYLFCGTRGTGKTSVAKILAKTVNCEHPIDGNPCNECEMCKQINKGVSVNVIELDAASNNGVANIREIIDELKYSPATGRYKVYIIDEVHMLSKGAFNALLKSLEEPPAYVIFILATTEVHMIPITIMSRCQRYDFHRITIDTIASHLKQLTEEEQLAVEDKALRYVAKIADGSMRDALSLLDRCVAFYPGQELTYDKALEVLGAVDNSVYTKLFESVEQDAIKDCMSIVDQIVLQGRDLTQFVVGYTKYLRDLLMIKMSGTENDYVDASEEQKKLFVELVKSVDENVLMRYIRIMSELSNQMKYASQRRILLEITIIKLCRPQMDHPQNMSSVLSRLAKMEKMLEEGVTVVGSPATPLQASSVGQQTDSGMENVEEVKELPMAMPEELKAAVKQWEKIKAKCGYSERPMLENAKLVMSDAGGLVLEFKDDFSEKYFMDNDGEKLKDVAEKIENEIGRKVNLSVRVSSAEEADKTPDLRSFINFDGQEEYV